MSKIWKMGISPDQFIADTVNLSDDEIGKYFRLLCYAWKNEAYLPLDIKRVCNIVKQCDEKSIQYLLETFFIKDEKGYFCKAQKIEFDWVVEKSGKAVESANKRWDKSQSERISERNANYSNSYNNNNSNNNKINNGPERPYTGNNVGIVFHEIWSNLKVKRGTRANGLKSYKKIHDKIKPNLLIEKFNLKCDSVKDQQFIPHFSTWLNSEGWTEELTTETKDDFNIQKLEPMRNLDLWKKGIKTQKDYDDDIVKAFKENKIPKDAMLKMGFSV